MNGVVVQLIFIIIPRGEDDKKTRKRKEKNKQDLVVAGDTAGDKTGAEIMKTKSEEAKKTE